MPEPSARHASLRIGELARRTGVPADTLRAWERRYQLLTPVRTASGQRLYSDADERTIHRMREQLVVGLSAAQAADVARALVAAGPVVSEPAADPAAQERLPRSGVELAMTLMNALDTFDGHTAHLALEGLIDSCTVDELLGDVFLPSLRRLGDRWARGEITVAQEHFASGILRQHLTQLARRQSGRDDGGPHVLIACAPGERHDLGALCFAVALGELGWRVTFLGADTPVATLADAAARLRPTAVVIVAIDQGRLTAAGGELGDLAATAPVWLGGAGAGPEIAADLGASCLHDELLVAAGQLDAAAAVSR